MYHEVLIRSEKTSEKQENRKDSGGHCGFVRRELDVTNDHPMICKTSTNSSLPWEPSLLIGRLLQIHGCWQRGGEAMDGVNLAVIVELETGGRRPDFMLSLTLEDKYP